MDSSQLNEAVKVLRKKFESMMAQRFDLGDCLKRAGSGYRSAIVEVAWQAFLFGVELKGEEELA
jgi:hypothetical protein